MTIWFASPTPEALWKAWPGARLMASTCAATSTGAISTPQRLRGRRRRDDNFEWMDGYRRTFGLVTVDRESFVPTVEPSARWLGEVASANEVR